MKIMLLHLSDIHIKSSEDVITQRATQIVDAVKNIDYSIDICAVVVTGDVAFSGSDEEYLVAWEFLENIKKLLSENLSGACRNDSGSVSLIVVPGNHDCDFTVSGETREVLVRSILLDNSKASAFDIVQNCIEVQTPFFGFLDVIEPFERTPAVDDRDVRLCYEYTLTFDKECIKFVCINTAWLSQRHETQGQLFFPSEAVPRRKDGPDLVVTAFHHPYNWMESNAARSFRDNIESMSDLILTGHEHVASMRTQEGSLGHNNVCVEGGVLQDSSDPAVSSFNIFIFDTSIRKQKFGYFRWGRDGYQLAEGSVFGDEGNGLAWSDYRINDLRTSSQLKLSQNMRNYLDDPGISLHHPDRGLLNLRDVFLYPDLREIRTRGERFGKRVHGDDVSELAHPGSKLLITGDTQSGKTCLAKMLFCDLLNKGIVPVFLDSDKRPPAGDSVFGFIEERFSEQYSPEMLNIYRQLNKSARAIIVDDYDKLPLKSAQKRDLLNRLSLSVDCLIVFSHDIASDLEELTNPATLPEGEGEISHYRIQPFGYAGRNRLAERWMLLGEGADPSEMSFVRNLARKNETLNTLVGKNYVPSYPVYVLSVLQALEEAKPIDIGASTHGYFYELFIKATLARGRSSVDFDIIASYLAYLAYHLQMRRVIVVSDSELRSIHEGYEEQYDIERSYNSLKLQLVDQNILVAVNDGFRFKYSYLYNYFVASYLRDHITEKHIRDIVIDLSGAMHIESNANILLFLAHLCKDPVVIEALVTASHAVYSDYLPAELQNDVSFLNDLETMLPEVVYDGADPKVVREALLDELDRNDPPEVGLTDQDTIEDEEEIDTDDPTVQYIAALRHLEILGQVVKNFPGSLEGRVKLDITRECYHLGLRSLSFVFEMIRASQSDILQHISEEVRKRHPEYTALEASNRAKESLTGLAHMLSYSMVQRVAKSVGSRELSNTYRRLLGESRSPASKLIYAALELDNNSEFPAMSIRASATEFEEAPLPLSVLRHLVVTHFHLFPVDFKTKQSICDAVGINYANFLRANPAPRMLPR